MLKTSTLKIYIYIYFRKMTNIQTKRITLLLTLMVLCDRVEGHGRLLEPPSRSSMWRQGYSNPINYSDNELNCGGANVSY